MKLSRIPTRIGVWPLGLFLAILFAANPVFSAQPIPIPIESPTVRHTFRFDAHDVNPRPHTVNICGTFNSWSRTDNLMTDDGHGVYTAAIDLEPGVYHYKFLVDGEQWFADPSSDKSQEDEDDHNNSGILITPDTSKLSPPNPDQIDPSGLAHNPTSETDCNVASDSLLRLRLRTAANGVTNVTVWYCTLENPHWSNQPLQTIEHILGFDRYGTVLRPNGSRAQYFFELTHGSATAFLSNGMLYDSKDAAQANPYSREMKPAFQTPDWAKHVIWYQIFPERFRNGDPSNDPPNTQRWQSNWYATLPGETPPRDGAYPGNIWNRRFGGDLQGIRQQLPYLRQLGVTAIYLNPIFQSDSAHKYDTRDYRHVDDFFGVKNSANELTGETDDPSTWKWSASDRVLLDLIQEAHRQGFRIVLDGVFNHVGKTNPLFQDVLKNGKSSPYAGWFEILDWGTGGRAGQPGGLQYKSWEGRNGGMALIKKDPNKGLADGPRQYILAITRRWLAPDGDPTRGVDGFRLDAAPDVPHPFWVEFRKVVKSIKPDAYISGEVWPWSQAWLQGDQFDAVMNYQFAIPCQNFFADQKKAITPSEFDQRLNLVFYNYPLQVVFDQMNLLDSHDTDRVASWFLNPDRSYNRPERRPGQRSTYNRDKPSATDWLRLHQLVDFQMTFPGCPMIYYGDEAGMWGPSDPSDRMPMWWKDREPFDNPQNEFNDEQFACYQRAIAARRQLPELQTGIFHRVLTDDSHGLYAFARDDGRQCAYIILNRSDKKTTISIPVNPTMPNTEYVDWLDSSQTALMPAALDQPESRPLLLIKPTTHTQHPQNNTLQISLPPFGSAILAPTN